MTNRTAIEQCIARGLTPAAIAADLNVDQREVDDVIRNMDELAGTITVSSRLPAVPDSPSIPTRHEPDRPRWTYYGPASPDVIEQIVEELYPNRHARARHSARDQKGVAA